MKLKDGKGHMVTVPAYNEIPQGVMHSILKQAGLAREDLELYLGR
jgi:predicted RNA binding protein YcfA (HicA-like mRNA interferase family)